MEKNKEKAENDTSSEATLERGKKAISADEEISRKDQADPKVKKEKEKDAEQWHNEG